MTIKTFIVDDEALARRRLRDLLADHVDVEIAGEFSSALEARAAISTSSPDLLLLDVQMPRMTGLKLAEVLADAPLPLIVFVTAHETFAVEAFDTRAVDYLLKPIRPDRLRRALARVRDQLAAMADPAPPADPIDPIAPQPELSRLMARSGERIVFVPVQEIDWIEAAGNYVIVQAGSERHIIRQTMATLERELPSARFVRLSRSLIVNVAAITALEAVGSGEYEAILKSKKRAPVTIGLRALEARLRFDRP